MCVHTLIVSVEKGCEVVVHMGPLEGRCKEWTFDVDVGEEVDKGMPSK